VGCRFDSHVSGSQFFTVNPDRRRRLLNTQVGDALCVFVCVCVCVNSLVCQNGVWSVCQQHRAVFPA